MLLVCENSKQCCIHSSGSGSSSLLLQTLSQPLQLLVHTEYSFFSYILHTGRAPGRRKKGYQAGPNMSLGLHTQDDDGHRARSRPQTTVDPRTAWLVVVGGTSELIADEVTTRRCTSGGAAGL